MESSWKSSTSGVPQGLILALVAFNNPFDDLENGAECNLSKFADNSNLGGMADIQITGEIG